MKKLIFLFLLLTLSLNAQEEILLENPSFEDFPRPSNAPSGWKNCGFQNESPPDTQPGGFDVTLNPKDGHTYLGMIVRDNETYESVGQKLSSPLKKDSCYSFSIHIARSLVYLSVTKSDTLRQVNHVALAKLRIWGSNIVCERGTLLTESSVIINTKWLEYDFIFQPEQELEYIIFEAFYKTPTLYPYNGNILLDKASSIQQISCNDLSTAKANLLAERKEKNSNLREERRVRDSICLAKLEILEDLVIRKWEAVTLEPKYKNLTPEGKSNLLEIVQLAQNMKIGKLVIGIHENEKKYNKKFDALDKFLTSNKVPIKICDIQPIVNEKFKVTPISINSMFSIHIE